MSMNEFWDAVEDGRLQWRKGAIKSLPGRSEAPATWHAVKVLGGVRVEALAVRYGSVKETDRSSHSDYFTSRTDLWLDRLPWPRPILYEHSLQSSDPAGAVVGQWTAYERIAEGVKLVGELDAAHPAYPQVVRDIRAGRLFLSSDSAPHLVRRRRVGAASEVLSWPLIAASLTRTPAEHRLPPATLAYALKAAGFDTLDVSLGAIAAETDAALRCLLLEVNLLELED